jgi:7tm Odorant receptor.
MLNKTPNFFQSFNNQKIEELIKFVQLLATAVLQVLQFCWFGNELTYQVVFCLLTLLLL